jgi:hypothetical protein
MASVTRMHESDHISSKLVAIMRDITYISCVCSLHYCDQHNDVINIKIITLALFYSVFFIVSLNTEIFKPYPGRCKLSSR